MKEFSIYIKEFLEQEVTVNADSLSDALKQVKQLYQEEKIILTSNNHVATEFELNEERDINNEDFLIVDKENFDDSLSTMKENQFYAIDISADFYADLMLLKKEKDTLWILSVNRISEIDSNKNSLSNYTVSNNMHSLIKFNEFQYLSFGLFTRVYQELYDTHMQNKTKGGEPNLYIVQTTIDLKELSVKKLHELYKMQEKANSKADKTPNLI